MVKIALLGFGNVGRAFARYLYACGEAAQYRICAVADISGGLILPEGEEDRWVLEMQEQSRLVADYADRGVFSDILSYIDSLPLNGISMLVECMPTNPADGQPALDLIHRAIGHRLPVVTVDKGPIVHGFETLKSLAQERGVGLAYSGTTGVRPPAEIAGCRVLEIRGIFNGTTNYILTEMQERDLSFSRALRQAQENGIAEPNPQLDIEGWDTACKLLILANEWMNARASITNVMRIGIGPETEQMISEAKAAGHRIRLIGRARLAGDRVKLSVAPKMCGPQSQFYSISGTSKGAVFATREKGELFAAGVSGREAIAKIILDDVKQVLAEIRNAGLEIRD